MPRPIHFEITADEPERAIQFYQQAFGWKATKWDGPMEYWLIETGEASEPGINGGMQRRGHTSGTTNTIGVSNIDEAIEKVTSAGGKIIMPKDEIPGVGFFAYCADTEGNLFGIMQPFRPQG